MSSAIFKPRICSDALRLWIMQRECECCN